MVFTFTPKVVYGNRAIPAGSNSGNKQGVIHVSLPAPLRTTLRCAPDHYYCCCTLPKKAVCQVVVVVVVVVAVVVVVVVAVVAVVVVVVVVVVVNEQGTSHPVSWSVHWCDNRPRLVLTSPMQYEQWLGTALRLRLSTGGQHLAFRGM